MVASRVARRVASGVDGRVMTGSGEVVEGSGSSCVAGGGELVGRSGALLEASGDVVDDERPGDSGDSADVEVVEDEEDVEDVADEELLVEDDEVLEVDVEVDEDEDEDGEVEVGAGSDRVDVGVGCCVVEVIGSGAPEGASVRGAEVTLPSGGSWATGSPSRAPIMKSVQISAGMVPPVTSA